MRSYSVATTTLALAVDAKWLDNLLSQHRVAGVKQSTQGVQRRLSPVALSVIATVHTLNRELQVPVTAAVRFAHELWREPWEPGSDQRDAVNGEAGTALDAPTVSDDAAELHLGEITLRVSRRDIRARIEAGLAEALEILPRVRRGRPPVRSRTQT